MAEQRYRFGGPIPESVLRIKERRAKRQEQAYWLDHGGRRLIARRDERRSLVGDSPSISRGTPGGLSEADSPVTQVLDRSESEQPRSGQLPPTKHRSL